MEFYLIIGVLLYIVVVIDILQTTLSMQGGGWFTGWFSHFFWKSFLVISGKNGKSKILTRTGYILLITIVIVWVLLLWASLFLILYSHPGAIVDSTNMRVANVGELVYYSGYTISTLGLGDYIPAGNIWRWISTIYSFTGLILLTMSVTYFIPVLSAVIAQRKLGLSIGTLGESPQDIVLSGWNGKNFEQLLGKVDKLAESIIEYSQQHRAYPVIHYFHNPKQKNNIILQLARLYEALFILTEKVKMEDRPPGQKLKPLLIAYENYFETIAEVTHVDIKNEKPPMVDISNLIKANLVENSNSVESLDGKNHRIMNTLIQYDGWNWEDMDTKKS